MIGITSVPSGTFTDVFAIGVALAVHEQLDHLRLPGISPGNDVATHLEVVFPRRRSVGPAAMSRNLISSVDGPAFSVPNPTVTTGTP